MNDSLIKLLSLIVMLTFCSVHHLQALTIYVSPTGSDDNDGQSPQHAIETLAKAKKMCLNSKDDSFEIFLQGGVVHSNFDEPESESFYDNSRTNEFGFVWDIDKPLVLSTYGSDEKAIIYGSKYTKGKKEATMPICVYRPSSEKVLIENLFIKMWQKGAIMVMESENVHIRNIKVDSIGTVYIPDDVLSPNGSDYPYVAGVIYPKNSSNILIENIVMTNCHNIFPSSDALHGFYCTRLNNSEIRNVYMKNVSGSPLKFRRAAANNVYVHDIQCYYSGTTNTHGSDELDQPGFVRYSGDVNSGCPSNILIENATFWYPYCWSDKEDCYQASSQPCSMSNEALCGGKNTCYEDQERIKWVNVDFRYDWVSDDGSIPLPPMYETN
ncbi:MAG: hypothetical protein RIF33_00205 [Cyclobacteriaceae bacterium]